MTNVYELADDSRGKLIFEKHQLLAPAQEGMVAAPHPMVAGLRERDYYLGKVTQATPEQRAWADAREADLSDLSKAGTSTETGGR
jgi:formate hydrogenlyase subunit 6/NADH:ubiquinone oxidoreductase subunit I